MKNQFVRFVTFAAVGLLTMLGLVVGVSQAASAAACTAGTYPPGQCQTIVLGESFVNAGGSVSVSGAGFTAGERVTAAFCSSGTVLGTDTADSSGRVSVTVTIPSSTRPGTHYICLTGAAGEHVSAAITVSGSTSGTTSSSSGSGSTSGIASGGLPQTGSNLAVLAGSGLTLLLIGTMLVLVVVRRRRQSA